ncbi:MAG: hypothetical protein P9M11_02260 [Candidatus Tenebribacter burtonii]|nr:hypothetical protein [Candidatus Tenebribacter burtonii]
MLKFSKLIIALLLFINISSLIALETPYYGTNSVSLGFGSLYQMTISHQSNDNYFALRNYVNINIFEAFVTSSFYSNVEYTLLYGKAYRFNSKSAGFIAISLGLSYFSQTRRGDYTGYETYEKIERSGFGIPLDICINKGFLGFLGTSLNFTVNINLEEIFGGVFLSLHLGDFRNSDYKQVYHNPKFSIEDSQMNNSINKSKNQYAIEVNPIKYMVNYAAENRHLNAELTYLNFIKDKDLIIPFTYTKDNGRDIYGNFTIYISLDAKLRNWLGKSERFYFEYGIRYIYLYDNIDNIERDYDFGCVSFSFGCHSQISEKLFINNKINVAFPLIGDTDNFYIFNGYGMNSRSFIMDLTILNIGFSF